MARLVRAPFPRATASWRKVPHWKGLVKHLTPLRSHRGELSFHRRLLLAFASSRLIKLGRILKEPALFDLGNVPYEGLVPGLHDLMEYHPVRLSVKHEGTGVGMQRRGS